ncbi:MAG TPA: YraN family protein [Chthoniobacteraceae bacterium]|nr:YraN family protein [Chthoniobacteraceae bacterium]
MFSTSGKSAAEQSPHLELGRRGENLATRHLRANGYKILHRNFTSLHGGEVDIVCREKKTLVFVEVKTRSSSEYGSPAHGVTLDQERSISRGALAWLRMLGNPTDIIFRFDIVEVLVEKSGTKVSLIRDAFKLSEPYRY